MMSKNPIELPPTRKFSKDEVAEALRLAIIAELDAVNLYNQLARAIEDEGVRKVFIDIAREEKTHVGEFLALLKSIDPEQVEELRRGAEEVEELTGVKSTDPPGSSTNSSSEPQGGGGGWSTVIESFTSAADRARVLRKRLPVTGFGRGVDVVPVEVVEVSGGAVRPRATRFVELEPVEVVFEVEQRALDRAARLGTHGFPTAELAGVRFGMSEDRVLVKHLLGAEEATTMPMGSWSSPGEAVNDVARAVAKLVEAGAPEPYLLLLSPSNIAKLVAVHERTGVMELARVKSLVADVVRLGVMPDDAAVVLSAAPQVVDVAIGADTVVDYVGPEGGRHVFRAWERVALRIKYPQGVVILRRG